MEPRIYESSSRRLSKHSVQKGVAVVMESKVELRNYDILVSQLNYCRFMYYTIENGGYLMLSWTAKGRLSLMLFKHLLKLIKQLADPKANWFGLAQWEAFKVSSKYLLTQKTLKEYCEKYEKEYLIFLKRAEINVIKDVNHRLPEFTAQDPFSQPFYQKVLVFTAPFIKECARNIAASAQEERGPDLAAKLEGLSSLLRYYRLVELSSRQFQDFGLFSSQSQLVVLKNYREGKLGQSDWLQLREEAKGL
jgi:hypothetical protein